MVDAQKLLDDLTEPQKQAVTHVVGPLLIVAGAGSGKTRVITRRVAYLMSIGVPGPSVLAITFTNKAAGEMKSRVSAMMSRPLRDFGKLDQPWPIVCTFHSLCLRILRHYCEVVSLPANFSVFDSADQSRLIKDAIKICDLSTTNFPPGSVHAAISRAKNQLQGPAAYAAANGGFYEKQVAKVYAKYQDLLKLNNALDFDDLLLRTAEAFRDHPQVLRELQDRFQYILIDEYQDTNHAQYVIAHALALRHRNLCVVGDPDQSIYAWRGADIRNILEFEQDYADARVVRLEQNYRSTKTILRIASHLIANNRQRKEKGLWTENDEGEKAKLVLCQDEHDEALQVAGMLKELHERGGIEWRGMAVFYRMNALSRLVEDALRRNGIPYQIARGVEFYNRKEIKDVLAYLRAIANPSDEVSLERIVNVPPRGIGDSSIKLLQTWAVAHGTGLWGAMEHSAQVSGLSTRAVTAIGKFAAMVERWRAMAQKPGGGDKHIVQQLMEDIVSKSGLEALFRKSADPDLPELANVNELISSAAEFGHENPRGTLSDYLGMISLVSDADHLKDAGGAVTLMTLHAAKGLEFPVVAIVGMEEGILPHSRARGSQNELEEERRLCFVGVTRAERRLILTKAGYRAIRGLRERTVGSPFLREMPEADLNVIDRTRLQSDDHRHLERERMEEESEQLSGRFRRGQLVRHPQFGIGRIADLNNMGQQTRAVVEFNSAGRKTLILEYARLEPIG